MTSIEKGDRSRFRTIAIGSVVLHMLTGLGVASLDIAPMIPGVWATEDEVAVIEITLLDELPPVTAPVRPKPLPPKKGMRKGIKKEAPPQGRKSGGGGGDPLERVTKMGVLGKLSGTSSGIRVAAANDDGVTYASDGMTQLLRGVGDSRRVAGAAAHGESGIGFGGGVGSGFGGGNAKQRASELVASLGDGSGDKLVLERSDGAIDGAELDFGGLDGCREEREIAEVVRAHKGGIRSCYNRSLLRAPDEGGEIAVRFLINQRGRVTSADILASSVRDIELEECVSQRILGWTFPPHPGCETVVRYSFHFSHDG